MFGGAFYWTVSSPHKLSVEHHWAAPGSEHTVAVPVSCSKGNIGPLWRDVDPSLLHLLPLMDSLSPLQVCISLIKRCLCASCLPSARFIIKVLEWEKKHCGGKSSQSSRFTNLWSSFHEWGGAPAAVPVEHTAVCLRREHSWSAHGGWLPRVRVH